MNAAALVNLLLAESPQPVSEVLGLMPQGSGALSVASGHGTYTKTFTLKDEAGKDWSFYVRFGESVRGHWSMSFSTNSGGLRGDFDKQDNGLEFGVMKMVAQICREFVADEDPTMLFFTASEDPYAKDPRKVDNRARLYTIMCRKLCKEVGCTFTATKAGGLTEFKVTFHALKR